MPHFSEQQEKYRERDDVKTVRMWAKATKVRTVTAEGIVYVDNPEGHPPICLTEDGIFVDLHGVPIPEDKIPGYILEECAIPEANPNHEARHVDMADVMLGEGVAGMMDKTGFVDPKTGTAYLPDGTIVEGEQPKPDPRVETKVAKEPEALAALRAQKAQKAQQAETETAAPVGAAPARPARRRGRPPKNAPAA